MKKALSWKRPYRLWDEQKKKDFPYRCFAIERNAQNAALMQARWMQVGASITVYDINDARVLGTYTRRVSSVTFLK